LIEDNIVYAMFYIHGFMYEKLRVNNCVIIDICVVGLLIGRCLYLYAVWSVYCCM